MNGLSDLFVYAFVEKELSNQRGITKVPILIAKIIFFVVHELNVRKYVQFKSRIFEIFLVQTIHNVSLSFESILNNTHIILE